MKIGFLTNALVEQAEKNNVRLCFENCPLMGNIAISPVMWKKLFERLPSDHLGLAYDPSHLVWEMIDPYTPLLEFKDKIFHVHAKDTAIDRVKLARTGILTDFSWWSYRIPGRGELDWRQLLGQLTAPRASRPSSRVARPVTPWTLHPSAPCCGSISPTCSTSCCPITSTAPTPSPRWKKA